MTILKQAFVELVLLTLASIGVALAANGIRERKSIDLTKNYFELGKGGSNKAGVAPAANSQGSAVGSAVPQKTSPAGQVRAASPDMPETPNQPLANAATASAAPKKHLEHDFQSIILAEVREVFEDPQTKQGLNIFVDARDEEHFAEGHIPGAIQCFPYEIERCLDRVKAAAGGAEKVVVYCGGGECEDSIFMCRELTEAGVPFEAVYLFEGGWKEWSASGLPTEGAE